MSRKTDMLADEDFMELSSKKNSISLALTVVELVVYFGFVFLIAFDKPFLSNKITPTITVGIPIGIGVILLSWLLTGVYVRWANSKYDDMVSKVKEKIGA